VLLLLLLLLLAVFCITKPPISIINPKQQHAPSSSGDASKLKLLMPFHPFRAIIELWVIVVTSATGT
jgi:hypothetical protein